jgi:hypothetical protein
MLAHRLQVSWVLLHYPFERNKQTKTSTKKQKIMRPINAPLNLGQTGDEVANLQEILMSLISKNVLVPDVPSLVNELAEERAKLLFGTATMTLVKNYQEQKEDIEPSDPGEPILNQATVNSINAALFNTVGVTIYGTVKHITGKPLVAVYQVVAENMGYSSNSVVGTGDVEASGAYIIEFSLTAAAYAQHSGYVITVKTDGGAVELATQKVYYKGTSHQVDFMVDDNSVSADSEYEAVTATLLLAIPDNVLSDINITDDDELQYLSSKTGEDKQVIVTVVQAVKLAEQLGDNSIAPQLYGILRQNIAPNLTVLLNQPKEATIRTLETAVANNLLPAMLPQQIEDFATALPSRIVTAIATDIALQPLEEAAPFLIANKALGDENKAKRFLELAAAYDHTGEKNIWEYLETEGVGIESEDIKALKTATTLSALTGNNPAMVNAMIDSYDGQSEGLGTWATAVMRSELITSITTLEGSATFKYPDFITGANKAEKYAGYLQEIIKKTYPTQAIKVALEDEEVNWGGLPLMKEHFSGFLALNNSFDLKSVPAHTITTANLPVMEADDKTAFIAELGIVQRLLNVTSNYPLINSMSAAGLHSSMQISNMSEGDFMTSFTGIAATDLKTAYDTASSNSAYTYVMAIDQFMSTGNSWGTLTPSFTEDQPTDVQQAYAEWRSLFGPLDSCNCSHCQSVYSPAAYLTDLLQFLKKNAMPLYDNLLQRRPDLVNIELSCKNINTPVPHLDIVNELLEDLVSYGKHEDIADHMYARQTTLDAKVQRAIPEYVNTGTYTPKLWDDHDKKYKEMSSPINSPYPILAQQVYPASLPYNYFKRQMDTHLDLQGIKGYDLVQRFSATNSLDAWNANTAGIKLCTEYLGLTEREKDIIVGAGSTPVYTFYGLKQSGGINLHTIPDPAVKGAEYPASGLFTSSMPTGLISLITTPISGLSSWGDLLAARVDVFLQQVQITYAELLQLVDCYVINPIVANETRKLAVRPNYDASSDDTCDLSQLCINGMNEVAISRIYRFVRLKRALGWTYYELDKAILGLGGKSYRSVDAGSIPIDDAMFVKLAGMHKLSKTLKLSITDVALFWKQIDTAPYRDYERSEPTDIPSEYVGIFRNSLTKDIDTADYPFKQNPANNIVTDDLLNYWSGVMHISVSEIEVLYNDLFPSPLLLTNSLANLTDLRRRVVLMRSLKMSAGELLEYIYWMASDNTFGAGTDVFSQAVNLLASPAAMIRFISFVQTVRDAGVKVSEVANLLRDASVDTIAEDKQNTKLAAMLRKLQQELLKVALPSYAAVEDEAGELLTSLLLNVLTQEEIEHLLHIVFDETADATELNSRRNAIKNDFGFFFSSDATQLQEIADALTDYTPNNTGAKLAIIHERLDAYLKRSLTITFLAKEFKLDQDVIKVLLENCIEVGATPVAGLEIFLQGEYLTDDDIRRWPAGDSQHAFAVVILLQKAAWLINKFRLSLNDVSYLWKENLIPGVFNLSDLPVAQVSTTTLDPLVIPSVKFNQWLSFLRWVEVSKFISTHTDSLYEAIKAHVNTDRTKTIERIATVFRMNNTDLSVLLDDQGTGTLGLDINSAFQLPQTYLRIIDCLEMQYLLPAPMVTLNTIAVNLGTPDTQDKANSLVQAVKAQYEDRQWLDVIQPVNDRLRTERRDALIAYLLANPPVGYGSKWFTSNDIFETLMLDVDMMSCMATTRVLLAVNTIQLWVDRVLLGLERDSDGDQLILKKSEARQWHTWRKLYRVWEANRKIFLYPENWIEPELRDDKSPFFLELEKFLKQNDLTDSNVEEAYRTYLERLDDVANLDIVGMYRETSQGDYKSFRYENDPMNRDTIHVFGRTPDSPHIYYYRKRVADEWKPWVKMDVQIDGDHFIPVMWKGRLRFYWLVFTKDQAEDTAAAMRSEEEYITPTAVRWKIQLAWTEYKNNKWTAKQISKDALFSRYITVEEPIIDDHAYFFKQSADRSWNFKGDLEKIRDEYINFFCENNNGNLFFNVIEKEYGITGIGLANHIDAARYTSLTTDGKWKRFNVDGLVNILKSNDEYMLGGFSYSGAFEVKFNGVKAISGYSLMKLSFYASLNAGGLLHRLFPEIIPNKTYKISKTNYWYYKEPNAGYSHFSDKDIQLLGFAPGHTATTQTILVDNKFSKGTMNAVTVKDKERSKYLVFPRVVPDSFTDGSKIATPYFFYKDYDNCFFVENVIVYDEIESIIATSSGAGSMDNEGVIDLPSGSLLGKVSRYRFHNFTHSNVGDFQEKLFKDGLDGLFNLEYLANTIQDKIAFKDKYQPTSAVLKGNGGRFYPKGHVDLSPDGAYSSYNWELFFHIPMLIANKLCQDQKFDEARRWYHYVFNPTVGGATKPADFWNFAEFYTNASNVPTPRQLMDDTNLDAAVARWANDPFKPHLVARTRISAYMKNTVMKYLDNLIAWGDMLFRTDTRENINEATLLYVLAAQMLGRRPQQIPARATPAVHTYQSLTANALRDINAFSNALVRIENIMLASGASRVRIVQGVQSANNLVSGSMYYFCLPANDKLNIYWNTLADRLFKIRHCQNIDGIERELALFDPPIDPALLVKAAAAGISLGEALSNINSPLPHYRFNVMAQKATELTQEVKSLGGQLLSALEKKDSEQLALLRSSNEMTMMDLVTEVKEQQVADTVTQINGLQQQQKSTTQRRDYYKRLVDGGLNGNEQLQLESLQNSIPLQIAHGSANSLAAALHLIPNLMVGPLSAGAQYGGGNIGNGIAIGGDVLRVLSEINSVTGQMAGIQGGYTRRKEDWEQQLKTADIELKQIDHQILGAQIRKAVAEMELRNHKVQVEHSRQMDEAMRNKYTNEELYEWMVSEISVTYFQAYKLALDIAKRAERSYSHELGLEAASFIQPTYWDSLKKGLLAGDQLMYDIKRMEVSFLEKNKRHLELTKHISLATLFPDALNNLKNGITKEIGQVTEHYCNIEIPEWLYDMDYPGHHLRRIKSVSISIPCVSGPYTTISCKLSLLNSKFRKSGIATGAYVENENPGNFTAQRGSIQSIATSHAQSDSGLFEFSFRDERYLPFEGAGAISTWKIELPAVYAQFDYNSISDVILHINYTSLDEGGLKTPATNHVKTQLSEIGKDGFFRMFSLNREFATEWNAYKNAFEQNENAALKIVLDEEQFPFYCKNREIILQHIGVVMTPVSGVEALPDSFSMMMYMDEGETQREMELAKKVNDDGTFFYEGEAVDEAALEFIQRNKKILKFVLLNGSGQKINLATYAAEFFLVLHCSCSTTLLNGPGTDDEDWDDNIELEQLAQPASITVVPGDAQLDITFASVSNATSYTVSVATNEGFSSGVKSVTGSLSPLSITGLTNGVAYYVRVIAKANDYLNSAAKVASGTYTPVASSSSEDLPSGLVSQMLAWWKADEIDSEDIVGGELNVWKDRSGNSRNATAAAAGKRPEIMANWRNGKPALAFRGGEALMRGSLPVPANTEDVTVFFVGEKVSTELGCVFELGDNVNSNPNGGLTYFLNDSGLDVAVLSKGGTFNRHGIPNNLTNNVKAVYEIGFIMSDLNPETYVAMNDTKYQVISSTPGSDGEHEDVYFVTDDFFIGGRNGDAYFGGFNLAEMIIMPSKPTPVEKMQILNYLNLKYDLNHFREVYSIKDDFSTEWNQVKDTVPPSGQYTLVTLPLTLDHSKFSSFAEGKDIVIPKFSVRWKPKNPNDASIQISVGTSPSAFNDYAYLNTSKPVLDFVFATPMTIAASGSGATLSITMQVNASFTIADVLDDLFLELNYELE